MTARVTARRFAIANAVGALAAATLILCAAIALMLTICIGRTVGSACDALDDYLHR